jgi:hypothetical protein
VSSFYRRTKNPVTGRHENACWMDDYFGRHRYGVAFGDGRVYRETDHQWEFTDGPPATTPAGEETRDGAQKRP